MDFAVAANHRVKIKESELTDQYLGLCQRIKKAMELEVAVIPIVIGVLGTVSKGLVRRLEELEIGYRIKTI